MYNHSLFIFRRDLRLHDNTGLLKALKNSKKVDVLFCFDPRQLEKNNLFNEHAFQFMIESLKDLQEKVSDKKGALHFFKGQPDKILEEIFTHHNIDAVYTNKDYTPFSIKRDKAIEKICQKHNAIFESFDDALVYPPYSILKDDGTPYSIFTPFYKKSTKIKARPALKLTQELAKTKLKNTYSINLKDITYSQNTHQAIPGGRTHGVKLLKKIVKAKDYHEFRNFPKHDNTSYLSAHNKFGTVSPREIFHIIKKHHTHDDTFIKELLWRDFFYNIAIHFPHVLTEPFHGKYKNIAWSKSKKLFTIWCEGKTGFPIVDAGMRELNKTGFMHNRVRMITASFLIKNLHINWQWGEKYFAEKLIDYDRCVNNGNWQWVASTGCDAQPYFRIFNPWLQQKKFDANAHYIKKWIPELQDISPKDIHNWEKTYKNFPDIYTHPIVDHKETSAITKKLYKI